MMRDLGLVSLVWQGDAIYARAGEWILGFDWPGDPVFAGPATPADAELLEILEETRLGLTFEQYVGTKDAVLIKAPVDLRYFELFGVLQVVAGFEYAEPNAVGVLTPAGA